MGSVPPPSPCASAEKRILLEFGGPTALSIWPPILDHVIEHFDTGSTTATEVQQAIGFIEYIAAAAESPAQGSGGFPTILVELVAPGDTLELREVISSLRIASGDGNIRLDNRVKETALKWLRGARASVDQASGRPRSRVGVSPVILAAAVAIVFVMAFMWMRSSSRERVARTASALLPRLTPSRHKHSKSCSNGCNPPARGVVAAASSGDVEELDAAFSRGGCTEEADEMGRTGLFFAALNGHVDAFQYLVAAGANVCNIDRAGWAPIYFASFGGSLEIAELLLHNPLVAKSTDLKLAKDLARRRGHDSVASLFSEAVPSTWA